MKSKGIFTRALCAILCTIMIIGMVPVTVAADGESVVLDVEDVTLTLDNTAVDGFYTVDVPVNVTTNGGLNSIQFDVAYDDGLILAGWTEGTVLPGADNGTSTAAEDLAKNPFTVLYGDVNATEGNENATNSTATDTLITLKFKVADTAAAGTTYNVELQNIFACTQPEKGESETVPAPVETSVATVAGGITTVAVEEGVVGKVNGKDLSITWNSYYTHNHTKENGMTGEFTYPDNSVVVNVSSTGWQNDGCADFTITSVPVDATVNTAVDKAPNHLNLDIKVDTLSASYTQVGSVLITAGSKSRSYDIDFSTSKEGVTRYQLNISNFGELSTIDSIKLMPFARQGGVLKNTEIEIASISYSYKELPEIKPIIYTAQDLKVSTLGAPLKAGTSCAYDYKRGLWVITANSDLSFGGGDGNRIQIDFPAVAADAGTPYAVVGIQAPTKKTDTDFNVYYNTTRTWKSSTAGGSIGTTSMGKIIRYLANDTANYGVYSIPGFAVNAWGQSAFEIPAGECAYVQYVAFFETLDEAQAFTYADPNTFENLFDDGDTATEVDAVVFDGEDLAAFTNAGTLKGDETGKYLSVGKNGKFNIKPTTDYLPASGAGSWFDYRYHVFVYEASGILSDGFDPRASIGSDAVYTFGNQDLKNTDGEIILQTIDLSLFTAGHGTPITNAWENPYYEINQCNVDGAQLDIYAIASFRTLDQVEAFKHLYIRKELHNDTASIALADGTASILTGETKSFSYELTGRADGLPVVSDATVKSVVYSVAGENATITADGEIKGVAAGTATVTATITLTNDDVITATADVEIKANPTPYALYKGSEITLSGSGNIAGTTSSYSKATGLVTATLPAFTGHDNARLHIDFEDVSVAYPYVAYGIRISNSTKGTDNTNPCISVGGGATDTRLWSSSANAAGFGNNQSYSKTEIKKHIVDISTFAGGEHGKWADATETDLIKKLIINDWTKDAAHEAGGTVDVQYVAFFDNLEDAQNYTYIVPAPRTITFMVNGNVYATQTVVEGETFDYPETVPSIPGEVFVGWDKEEGVVTGDLTVNAIFGAPKVLYTYKDGLSIPVGGKVVLNNVGVTANEGPYYRFTSTGAGTSNAYADGDWAYFRIPTVATDFPEFDIKTDDVIVIRYRTNLSGANFDLCPEFSGNRLWGGTNPNLKADGEWHSYVMDLSEKGYNGGQLGTNTWAYGLENFTFQGVQIRPFYGNGPIQQVGGYMDIKYVAFFDSVAAANAYEYIEPVYHTVEFYANGELVDTKYIADGNKIEYPASEPTPPEGYKFVKWNTPSTTVITSDLTVNAVFALGSSVAADTIVYGSDLTYTPGSIYQSTIEYSDTTAIFRPDTNGTKDTNWANNGCALLTANGLNIPTTHKYLVIGMTTYVDKDKYPNYNGSSTKNVELYVDGSNKGYIDVDLASHVGTQLYAHVVDGSSLVTSGTAITNIRFDPILNKDKGSTDANARYGTGGHFRLGFIAAFDSLEAAQAYAAAYNVVAETVEVTVSATEGGSVIGASGEYAVGSLATFTAVPAEGYVLDGWYLNAAEEAASTATTYTLTISAATAIEARFVKAINKTVAKLEVVNGADDTYGSVTVTGGVVGDNYVASGTAVEITATETEAGVFGYWQRTVSTSGISVYLGINESIDAYALGTGVFYQPVFFPANTTGKVIYVDATNTILSVDGEPATNPSKPGYTFNGWKVREANTVVTVKEPVYVIDDTTTSTLTVYAANGVATSYAPSFNEPVTVDAGANNVVWTLKIGNKSYPVSYNREYSFRYRITAASATLTATATNEAPKALVSGIEAVYADAATRFIGSYYVPESYTVTGYGMLLTSNAAVANDMNLNTDGVIVGNLATAVNEDSMMFVVNKNKTLVGETRTTWYGRAFLMYTDGTDTHVIYGDTISK